MIKGTAFGKRKGFALILAIGAMSFMVLLTLALSSVISAKLRLVGAQKEMRAARSNAVLGMSVAISELQRTLGKDNAVSFPASVFDADIDTPKIDGVLAPYVLGALEIRKDAREYTPYELQMEQSAISEKLCAGGEVPEVTWLVSGRRRMKNPIVESPETLAHESVTLARYKALESYPEEYGGLVNSRLKSEVVEVKAGKVGLGRNSSGSYAFWISDESLKAKINLARPEKYLEEDMGDAQSCEAPADSRVPQISNTSFVEDVAGLGLNPFLSDFNDENSKRVAKIGSLSELALADSNLAEWARDNMGDWTASSVGLPVDVTQGRLKQDLSAYIYGGRGLDDRDPIIRGGGRQSDGSYSGADFGLESYARNLPTFGLLRTWANIAENVDSFDDGVDPRPHVIDQSKPQQHGIYPVINSIKWIMVPAYSISGGSISDIRKGDEAAVNLSMVMWPRIVIWNPHNVKLNPSDYLIRIYMPFRVKIGPDPDFASARTRWRVYEDGQKKGDVVVNYKATESKRVHFGDLFKNCAADNKMPVMTFQVENLELRPGESVELNVRSGGSHMETYADLPYSDIGLKNMLQPSMISIFDGPNDTARAMERQCIKIDLGIQMTIDSVQGADILPDGLEYMPDGTWRFEDEGGRVTVVKPFSHLIYESNPGIYQEKPALPYLETTVSDTDKWRIIEEAYKGSSKRGGYEIILKKSGERLFKSDMTEWESSAGIISDANRGRASSEMSLGFGEGGLTGKLNDYLQADQYSAVINPEDVLFDCDMGEEDMSKNCRVAFVIKDAGGVLDVVYKGVWESDKFVRNIRLPDFFITNNMIFTAANYRAPSLVSGDLDDGAVLKKAGDKLGKYEAAKLNFALAHRYMRRSFRFDAFFGKRDGGLKQLDYTGMYSWKVGEPITFPPGAYGDGGTPEILTNSLLARYKSGDGFNRRFGEPLFMSGYSGYPFDSMISAPFDYPRGENDIMSLGMFSRANLSPMVWQPTFAFGNSHVSPYMDRENVVEQKAINENELVDICYLLNASMWDRFYLSTIPQNDLSFEPRAGMRLPNTRLFLKSAPDEKGKLAGSDEAFENSAAYVGVDGAFNVNSTSYEAWRAVLGGMLGTRKKTALGEYINSAEQGSDDPDSLKMPNPGDLHPLSVPETKECFTWVDTMVGRMISESEIDMLAREIVREVKIRAPFFSLSDFVNRRLMRYSDIGDDENLKYQSLMGTLAAAIRKCELIEDRPEYFFNDKSLDFRVSRIDKPDGYSYVYNISTLSVFSPNSSDKRDLGEQVKRNEDQYIEHAICTPYDKAKWAHKTVGLRGLLGQSDLLSAIAPVISVRGDTFTIRAYGESKNPMTGAVSRAYCEAVVQRTSEPVDAGDGIVAPESPFGRRFGVVSFRWLTPAEL